MTAAAALLLCPCLGALLAALLPGQGRLWLGLSAGLALLAALALPAAPPPSALLAADPLARPFLLLFALAGAAAAIAPAPKALRWQPALMLAVLAFCLLALLAAAPPLAWGAQLLALLFAIALLAEVSRPAARSLLAAALPSAIVVLAGLILLAAGQPGAGWAWRGGRAAEGAGTALAGLLLAAGCLGLSGLLPMQPWLARSAAVLPGGAAVVTLVLVPLLGVLGLARLQAAGGGGLAELLLIACGLLSLGVGAAALWRGGGLRGAAGAAALCHLGLIAVSLGLAGPAGLMAALLLALGYGVAMSAALLSADQAGRPAAAALLALAWLPPFLPFAGLFLLLSSIARQMPWLLLALLPALAVAATGLARRAWSLSRGPGGLLPGAGVLVLLGLLGLLGVAMPPFLAAWLAEAAAWQR
ncbi:MAG: hypothetical protein RMK64_13060 [Rhodovarius sp.]|nr:hypothetical protein [Rhodovarius sp.]MDW8315893.1 hypothetical protein [Rhodovarius sp.]